MKMTELCEAFRTWSRDNFDASIIVEELRDPTPITEEGLRELGFKQYFGSCVWWLGELRFTYEDDTLRFDRREVKTMGQLRGLLLFVGEQ